MKKFFAILLGLVIAVPAMAANVNDINRQAYLHHLKEMNGMRKGIVKLLSKSDRTAEEQKFFDSVKDVKSLSSEDQKKYNTIAH